MDIHFSPMQGYVDNAYRRLHSDIYGGIDAYYTPFIRIEKGAPRHQDMSRLEASAGDGTPLVPQIIFGSVDEFRTLSDAVRSMGYDRIDLNLGCPYPMQTRRGRGASMICNTQVMREIADIIAHDPAVKYSVKMRIGNTAPDDWTSLLPILNGCRLEHITIHPRIATQMYSGDLLSDEFGRLLKESVNPIIWNGEIHTVTELDSIIAKYPDIKGVMIGRGLLARPSLAAEWRASTEWSQEQRISKLLQMHSRLLLQYEGTLCGETQILQKIKPFWEYLEPEIGHKAYKAIRKASSLNKYKNVVTGIE